MSRQVYDLAMLIAWGLGSTGAGLQWGIAPGLIVAGVWLAAATLVGAWLTGGR